MLGRTDKVSGRIVIFQQQDTSCIYTALIYYVQIVSFMIVSLILDQLAVCHYLVVFKHRHGERKRRQEATEKKNWRTTKYFLWRKSSFTHNSQTLSIITRYGRNVCICNVCVTHRIVCAFSLPRTITTINNPIRFTQAMYYNSPTEINGVHK